MNFRKYIPVLLNDETPTDKGSSYPLNVIQWWVWVNSNHRPHPYQGCALTKLSYRPVLKRGGILAFIHERLKPRY